MSRVTRRPRAGFALLLVALLAGSYALDAQVTGDRLLRAASEPHNWLTYGGTYTSQRYSTLDQITPANVARLESKWVVQNQVFGAWQSNPIVVDGVMYITQRPNDVMAVDAKTGALYWLYRHTPSTDAKVCCGANNRGVAILGDLVFMGTLDARLIAIDRVSGKARWNIAVGEVKAGYSITMAPLVIKDKVLVGVGGGEYGIRGYVAAYDAKNAEAIARLVAAGTQLTVLPDEIIKALRVALEQVLDEEAAANEQFKKILANWRAFRANQHRWFSIADTRAENAVYRSAPA